MKKVILFFAVFMGIFFLEFITSCQKDNYINTAIVTTKMENLKVPSTFNWKTAREVGISISKLTPGVVLISSSDGSKLYYKSYYSGTPSTFQLSLTLPTTVKEIQINNELVTIPSSNFINYTMLNIKSLAISNYSMYFNGTNATIKVPTTASTVFTNQVSMEAWVKLSAFQTAKIVEKADWNGFGLGVDLYKGFQTSVYLKTAQSIVIDWGGNRPVLNQWYHLAMTFDGSQLCLYVNGVLRNSATASSILWANTYAISIGSDSGNQKFFKGWIDEVSVWNVPLTGQYIADNMNKTLIGNETGLYAYWQFNEGAGTTVYDKTVHHYDGAVTNATWNTDIGYAILDSDGDGVPDIYDDYPNDPTRAFDNYFPSQGPASLAFEDLWPSKGDYDFNDLVVDYQFKTVTNSQNRVAQVTAKFIIRAAGAGFENGFGFQLPELLPDADITVTGSSIKHNYISLNSNGTEAGQAKTTIIVFDDVFDLMQNPGIGVGVNTTPGAPYVTPDTLSITMTFKPNTYSALDLGLDKFNPFLIIDKNRGKEVHLPDYAPTSLADPTLFGTGDDNSSVASSRYYKTQNNLPWVINISSSYSYTNETVQIVSGYNYFGTWAQSGGTVKTDWYLDLPGYRNASSIYKKP
jgi:LruC domain-containing protein